VTAELTPREAQIVDLLRGGLTQRAIAKRLGISRRTVEAHVAHIRAKTGAATTAAALARARRGARPRPTHGGHPDNYVGD
jgi:DNA-binding CsgD family transcriptional regulator